MRFPPWGDVMGMVDGNGNLLLSFIYEGFGAGYYTIGTCLGICERSNYE